MPFHEKYRKDNRGNVIKDENDVPIVDKEGVDYNKFPVNFLANTKEEADKLYKKHLNVLQILAVKYSRLTGLNKEDFIQEGVIGLARASRDFIDGRSRDFNIFAIYKIKDSMREFVSSQGAAIKVPQYIKDAISLTERLKKLVNTMEPMYNSSMLDIWKASSKYEKSDNVIESIIGIRNSIANLAERSCTTVDQLIERAELMPTNMELVDIDHNIDRSYDNDEESLMSRMIAKESIMSIKNILPESDYKLIVSHFIDGKTVRELAKETGLKAPSITVKIHNIVAELLKKEDVILNANSKDTKKTGNGDSS